jgi:hypothetical protein
MDDLLDALRPSARCGCQLLVLSLAAAAGLGFIAWGHPAPLLAGVRFLAEEES